MKAPRYLNWSVGLEHKLGWQLYLKTEFIQKRGTNGLAYNWVNPVDLGAPGVTDYGGDLPSTEWARGPL